MNDIRKTLIRKPKHELVDMILEITKERWVLVHLPNGHPKWCLLDNLKDVPR